MHVHAQSLNCVQLFSTSWTVACLVPLTVTFSRQEYWSRLLAFPPPGQLPNPGIELTSLVSPALAGGLFTTVPTSKRVKKTGKINF